MNGHGRVSCAGAVLLVLATGVGGCATLTYDQIRIGAAPAEYDRVLPGATTRPTEAGLAHFERRGDEGDAIVVLLTPQRRVAGKFHVRRAADPEWMVRRRPRFHLVGELDPAIYGVEQTSPIDVARLIIAQLRADEGESIVRDAHAWVAAGLRRWVERWPGPADGLGETPPDEAGLAPAGGVLFFKRDGGGQLQFEYSAN